MFLAMLVCFITESRSNFLFTCLVFFLLLSTSKLRWPSRFIILFVVFGGIGFIFYTVASFSDTLLQRFDLSDSEYQYRTSQSRVGFIFAFLDEFVRNPMGKGILDAEVSYGDFNSMMLHNQYLTFVLSGGIIAMFGVLLWIIKFSSLFLRNLRSVSLGEFPRAIVYSAFVFFLTLTTLEFTGLLMFVLFSLLFWFNKYLTNPENIIHSHKSFQ